MAVVKVLDVVTPNSNIGTHTSTAGYQHNGSGNRRVGTTTASTPTNLVAQAVANKYPTMVQSAVTGGVAGANNPLVKLEQDLNSKLQANPPQSTGGAGSASGSTASTTTTTGSGYVSAPNQSMDYMNQLSAMLQAQQAQQQAQLAAQQAAKEQAVRNAYNNNLSSLQNAYANRTANLGNTLDSTLAQLGENYDYSAEKIAQNAENALREAYVNRMLSQKNLQQQLNAQGLTGGAAESAIAGLLNNYGNARNNIETQRMNNLADLLNMYQNNVATAREKYNSALNDIENANYNYQAQMQRDLANGVVGTYDDLYSALASGANTYANAMQGLAASQVGNAADLAATNYKNYLNAMNKGTTSTTKTSGSKKTVDSSVANTIRSRVAASNIQQVAQELYNELGDYELVMDYLKAAGVY